MTPSESGRSSAKRHSGRTSQTTGRKRGFDLYGRRRGTLELSINRRCPVIELGLTGDLDMTTAPRLGEAMAWLRFSRGPAATIVIDMSDLDFVAAAGYRALLAASVGLGGRPDPRVALIVGPAVARLEAAISAASTRRARRSEHPGYARG